MKVIGFNFDNIEARKLILSIVEQQTDDEAVYLLTAEDKTDVGLWIIDNSDKISVQVRNDDDETTWEQPGSVLITHKKFPSDHFVEDISEYIGVHA